MHQRTSGHWPANSHPKRPRLLVENASPALRHADFRVFQEAGFEVALCTGPDADDPCLLVEQGACTLANCADVVLFGLGHAEPSHREVLRALRARFPTTAVVIEVPRRESGGHPVPGGCPVLAFPASLEGQVRALRQAVAASRTRRRHPPPGSPPDDGIGWG